MSSSNPSPAYYEALRSQRGVNVSVPLAVGEFEGYVDGVDGMKPSVRWLDRKNMPQVGDCLFAIPASAAAPRSWAILLTSANHGTVGPVGSTFPHAGEQHERVQVMEIVEAGAPPAPDVDLAGLVRLELTNEQIAAGAIVRCDHGGSIGRNGAIEVWDAMMAAAPVAAQAGQVVVPGWISVDERLPDDDCQVLAATWFTMTHNQHQDIVSFRRGTGKFSHSDVTHWMPLPPLPAKESK